MKIDESRLKAKLLSTNSQRQKEPSLMTAISNLKKSIKLQNKIISELIEGIDLLSLVKEKSKSPQIREAIDMVTGRVEKLHSNKSSLQSAFFEVEKVGARTMIEQKPADPQPTMNYVISDPIRKRLDDQDQKLDSIMSRLVAIHEARTVNWPSIPSTGKSTKKKEVGEKMAEASSQSSSKRPKNPQKPRMRPDAIIVQAEGVPYTDMLKRIKENEAVQGIGKNFNKVSMTKAGHLRVVLNRGTEEEGKIAETLAKAIGDNAKAINLKDSSRILISDVDEGASNEDIMEAILAKTGSLQHTTIDRKTKIGRGVQLVMISLSTSAAKLITGSKLRIGYVNCRTKLMKEVKKCFKCQGFGHVRADCIDDDRAKLCWRCGKQGHKSRECEDEPKCVLCKEVSADDHVLGSFRCYAYKRALETTK